MDELLNLLGIANRAKKLIYGSDMLKDMSKIKLIFLASDISSNSKERFEKKAYHYKINIIDTYESSALSKAVGKDNIKAIGVLDEGFKKALEAKL